MDFTTMAGAADGLGLECPAADGLHVLPCDRKAAKMHYPLLQLQNWVKKIVANYSTLIGGAVCLHECMASSNAKR